MRYQTEIYISLDRYVCLQLPSFFPEGKAVVTVTVEADDPRGSRADPNPGVEDDRGDIEWWDEFDEPDRHPR